MRLPNIKEFRVNLSTGLKEKRVETPLYYRYDTVFVVLGKTLWTVKKGRIHIRKL